MDGNYPRQPDGLEYNTAFGASAILHMSWAWDIPTAPIDTPPVAPALRTKSLYLGVTLLGAKGTRRLQWRAEAKRGGKHLIGPARDYTDEGELQAARDYAQIVGIPGPVLRGTR